MKKIAVLVGSLRKESVNKKIAKEIIRLAPKSLSLEIVEIGNLNLYNQDLEENVPASWRKFRNELKEADGVIFVSPEYNRSIPGVLKNAIDVATRPPAKNVLMKKPALVATASGSGISGVAANHAIRQSIIFSRMYVLPTEIYIGNMNVLFEEDGKTLIESTQKFLQTVLLEFEDWVQKLS